MCKVRQGHVSGQHPSSGIAPPGHACTPPNYTLLTLSAQTLFGFWRDNLQQLTKKKKPVYIQKEAVDHQQEGEGQHLGIEPPWGLLAEPRLLRGGSARGCVCRAHGHLLALLTAGSGGNSGAGSPRGSSTQDSVPS